MGAALLGAFRLSRSAEARKVYGKTWKLARATSARLGSVASDAREAVARPKR